MIDDIEEVDEREFEDIKAENRNKELIKAINKISLLFNEKNIIDAINSQSENILKIVKAVKEIPKSEEVNIELNPKEFISSVNKICEDIIMSNSRLINSIENRLLPESFELIRAYGVTSSVNVKYKSAKEINKDGSR